MVDMILSLLFEKAKVNHVGGLLLVKYDQKAASPMSDDSVSGSREHNPASHLLLSTVINAERSSQQCSHMSEGTNIK